ncbi:MAG: UMP kinase [Nanoarchaeota archaeon]|nr:UMP kinase [Nanoarchaeota archaeon]
MNVEVLSIGGSLIFRNGKVRVDYIRKLKKLIDSYSDRKFVIVVGGGSIARVYINALEKFRLSDEFKGHIGIAITRVNARMVANIFGKHANANNLPKSIKDIRGLLLKHKIVICGALRYEKDVTTDSTAAKIALGLKAEFINVTNVKGLYSRDPRKYAFAKFISHINYDDFSRIASKMNYRPGQHFVLDQHAAKIIRDHKIPTYILGSSLGNLKKFLDGYNFVGTRISQDL